MKEQFIGWRPNAASRQRLEVIGGILDGYKQMGNIRLTLRQLYYRLVSANVVKNEHREYKRLGALLSQARLAGLVDWAAIEDRHRGAESAPEWGSIQDLAEAASRQFRLPRWQDQPEYMELWCEKDALSSVLWPICFELHVTLMVNKGYSSSSAMYESAKRIAETAAGREATVLYLGDFDPSGEDMVRDIRDRLATFRTECGVEKIALNPDQIKRYKLPPNTAKMTDSRADGFVAEHGANSYEVDALPPEVLQKLVRKSIVDRMDMDLYEEVKSQEDRLRGRLLAAARRLK